jgi:SAM-dependent methyltransferase
MPPSFTALVGQHLGANFAARLGATFAVFARDFWHDGSENPFAGFLPRKPSATSTAAVIAAAQPATPTAASSVWHAAPGEIAEKMWGPGMVLPGDGAITEKLCKPFNLTREMSVLDLSAGLGARLRRVAKEAGVVAGLESDPAIASRGMALSRQAGQGKEAPVASYDPSNFSGNHSFDCMLAREVFYLVPNKPALFKAIAGCLKSKGQIAFTDYIVDPENRARPAIAAWCGHEKSATPFGLVEMAEAWAKVGIDLRVNEDLSVFYKQEVAAGLKCLATFLVSGPRPDAETKAALRRQLELWTYRMGAMGQGMKFFRFYGTHG